jgi:hypothetical protein
VREVRARHGAELAEEGRRWQTRLQEQEDRFGALQAHAEGLARALARARAGIIAVAGKKGSEKGETGASMWAEEGGGGSGAGLEPGEGFDFGL